MSDINLNASDLVRMAKKLTSAQTNIKHYMEAGLLEAALVVQATAKREAPVRHGTLRKSIVYKVNGFKAVIYPDPTKAPYAAFVEEGTGIYGPMKRPITPKSAKVLATKVNPGWGKANKAGYFIIGTSSKGQKPNPFMHRAEQKSKGAVTALLRKVTSEVSKDIKL